MPTKNDIIKNVYTTYYGTKGETLEQIKDDPDYDEYKITKKDVDQWFLTSYLTEGSKKPEKSKFNSFVAKEPLHVIQVDLFNYSFNQKLDKDDLKIWKKQPQPYGLIGIDIFTKQVHVVPMEEKTAVDWKRGVNEIVKVLGKPKIIMTDPDSSITSNEMEEWFRNNKEVQHVMTRRHAVFAEKAIRFFKKKMNQKVSKEVKPWTEYITSVLQRINTGKETVAAGKREAKERPNRTTEFTPEEAAKPENWFEVHNNMEIKARHNRKYPEINIGDTVKVYKQRGALEKEWIGDYKPDTTTVTEITKSLGQTFYKVIGEGKPFIRSEILLVRKIREDEVAPQEAIPELYLSNKREQIIKRDNKALQKANLQMLNEKKKDIDKQIKEEAKAAKAKGKEDTKTYNANKKARDTADKARLKKGLSRTNWRGEPIKGLV